MTDHGSDEVPVEEPLNLRLAVLLAMAMFVLGGVNCRFFGTG